MPDSNQEVTNTEGKIAGEISDGYHTFNELYHHRMVLFSIICNSNKDKAFKSKLHADGTMFDDYFIVGVNTPEGHYTYHYHMNNWDRFQVKELEHAPEWDGHQPCDIDRLLMLESSGDCPIEEGDEFDFGSAVYLLKIGKKVARKGWNGSGMFVYYVPAASYPVERNNLETMGGQFPDDMVPYREYLALKTAQGDVATWAPSVSDALATDWCLA